MPVFRDEAVNKAWCAFFFKMTYIYYKYYILCHTKFKK